MLTKLVMLCLILPVLTKIEEEDQRIITTLNHSRFRVATTSVKGKIVPKGHFSFLVSLKRSFQKVSRTKFQWSTYCGGAIIHPTKVVTAAQCFELKEFYYLTHYYLLRAVAGSTDNHIAHQGFTVDEDGVQWRQITKVKVHKDFHFPVNDIAVLSVDIPFDFFRIITYYNAFEHNADYEGNCYTAGYGQIGLVPKEKLSKILLFAEIYIMSKARCSAIWGMNMDTFVCSDSVVTDISGGDTGGPLICRVSHKKPLRADDNRNYVLVGITSGKNSDKTKLYTRVSAYQNWLDGPVFRSQSESRSPSGARRLNISILSLVLCMFLIKLVCTCFDCIYL